MTFGGENLELIASQINDLSRTNWGDLMIDAIKTPGDNRVRLAYHINGEYVTMTVRSDGVYSCRGQIQPPPAGVDCDATLAVWGRMGDEDAQSVLGAISAKRAAAGLETLGKDWRLIAAGRDNPEIEWGKMTPPPPIWWVIERFL